MTVLEIVDILQGTVVAGAGKINNEISGGYVSDLLSNVMSQGKSGNLWVTMHGHQNIVAVASLLGLSVVILAGHVQPDKETVTKADAEEIPIVMTALPAFQVVGLLYSKGIMAV